MNGRKARQARSQGGQKRLRRFRKDVRVAEEAVRAEAAEAEAAWQEEYAATVDALAEEPQFAIVNPFNGETLVVAAQSMIWPLSVNGRGEPLEEQPDAMKPHIIAPEGSLTDDGIERLSADGFGVEVTPQVILPGTAAALGIDTP